MSKPINIPNSKCKEELLDSYQNYVIYYKDNIENEDLKYYKIVKSLKNLGLSKSLPTYSSSPSFKLNSFNPLLNHLNESNIEFNSSNIYSKSEDSNCLLEYMSIYMDTSSDSDKDNKESVNDTQIYDDNYMFPREVFENVAKTLFEVEEQDYCN